MVQRVREALADPWASATTQAIADGALELRIQFRRPGPPVRHVYQVHTRRWLITEAGVYEGNELVDPVRCAECRLNLGLTERGLKL